MGRNAAIIASLGFVLSSSLAFARFEDVVKSVSNYDGKHAICYVDPATKAATGINVKEKVRLASTTKLLTSYWAISKLGPSFRYTTTLYFDPKTEELHISGQRDPFFGERRLYHLVSELNKMGITKVSKVTFDKSFSLFRGVEEKANRAIEITQHGGIKSEFVENNLKQFLNVGSWTRQMESNYIELDQQAKSFDVTMINQSELRLTADEAKFSATNPLKDRPNVRVLKTQSPTMEKYLKIMNRYSLNYPADEIFEYLGGAAAYAKFIKEDLGITEEEMKIYVGSGLPNFSTGSRKDGWSTCETMVRVIMAMENKLKIHGRSLTDVVMVAGEDPGTLNGFYSNEDFDASVVAKTGTLGSAVTLSGFINTGDGRIYFGIFFQTQSTSAARAARDRAIIQIADSHNGPKSTGYDFKGQFYPFDAKSGLTEATVIAEAGAQ